MGAERSFLKRFIKLNKWETVFFTQDLEQYTKVKGILIDKNIVVKTKIINNSGGLTRSERSGYIKNCYEILVKQESVYQANNALHGIVI
jgi:hypothetical protein